MYCTSKGKVKYYETGWIVLELVLDRHSVERVVRAYTAARTERSMLVQPIRKFVWSFGKWIPESIK